MTKIFLSYARGDDEAFVRRLYDDLVARGFTVWFDRVDMPSRGLPFPHELRDAINLGDRFVLILGPMAVTSAWCRAEWQHAVTFGKPVTPVLRLDGQMADGSRLDGISLLPEEMIFLHVDDFRDDATYQANLEILARQLAELPAPLGKLIGVPGLPPHLLVRQENIRALKDALLADFTRPIAITGLNGMGGIGKSVLANLLARDPDVRRAFPDGVAWVPFGTTPDLVQLQRNLARELGDEGLFENVAQGRAKLADILASKKVFLVLDDVWQRQDAEAFNILNPLCRAVITSRDAGLVTSLGGRQYQVQLLTDADALDLLAGAAGVESETLPADAREIVKRCDHLPLALALCGGLVRRGVAWAGVVQRLKKAALENIGDRQSENPQHQSLWATIKISIDALSPDDQQRFIELCVFPKERSVPEIAVRTLWQHTGGLDEFACEDLLISLKERSLIVLETEMPRPGQAAIRFISMHDLLHDFAAKEAGDIKLRHNELLDAYRKQCPCGWHTGPDDGYFLQSICHHLGETGRDDERVDLLCDLHFVEARCMAGQVFELISDYRLALESLPEAQTSIREQLELQDRVQRWTDDMVAYAQDWSARRDAVARGAQAQPSVPNVPAPPPACLMRTEEDIRAASEGIPPHSTRMARLESVAAFASGQCYPLSLHGKHPGFVLQHAFNSAPLGLVHESASRLLADFKKPVILLHTGNDPAFRRQQTATKTLMGHDDMVTGVRLTHDRRLALSSSADGTLRLWDSGTAKCLHAFQGHEGSIHAMDLSPDGRWAVSGSIDHTVRIWDLGRRQCVRVLDEMKCSPRALRITPDGRILVIGSGDYSVNLVDLGASGKMEYLFGHRGSVEAVSLTPDGRRALSGSCDMTLRLWDLDSRKCIATLTGHTDTITSVCMTPDGEHAVSGSADRTIRVWDLRTLGCAGILEGHSGAVYSVAVTADGSRVISGSADKTLRVWALDPCRCVGVLEGHAGTVYSADMTPDARCIVSGASDKTVKIWDLSGISSPHAPREPGGAITSLCLCDGGRGIIAGMSTNVLMKWDVEQGRSPQTYRGHSAAVNAVASAMGGKLIISLSKDKTLRVWDAESGQCRNIKNFDVPIMCVCATDVPSRRCAVGLEDNRTVVSNLDTLENIAEFETPAVSAAGFTPDGKHLIWGSLDATVHIWDIDSKKCVNMLKGHEKPVRSIAVAPDGAYAVSAGDDNDMRVWDVRSGQCRMTLKGHSGPVRALIITPDGKYIVSSSEDGSLRAWSSESGECLCVYSTWTPLTSLALVAHAPLIIAGPLTGPLICLKPQGFAPGPAIATTSYEKMGLDYYGGRFATRCAVCGKEFEPTEDTKKVLRAHLAQRLGDVANAAAPKPGGAAPSRDHILTSCPDCAHPLRLGFMVVDSGVQTVVLESTLKLFREQLGPLHPETLRIMNKQAELIMQQGDAATAETLRNKAGAATALYEKVTQEATVLEASQTALLGSPFVL